MDDKQKKQEELLTELKSIKDLLDNDFLDDDDFVDPRANQAQLDQALLADNIDSSIEIPLLSEMIIDDEPLVKYSIEANEGQNSALAIKEPKETSTPSNVLPGQRSLFDKEKDVDDKLKSTQEQSQRQSYKSASENPFLPKHIRERLTKPSDLKAILAGDPSKIEKPVVLPPIVKTAVEQEERFFSANSFLEDARGTSDKGQSLEDIFKKIPSHEASQPAATSNETLSATSDIDRLIDNLIAQYLPEIEAKLRFQLKQLLDKKPTEKTNS